MKSKRPALSTTSELEADGGAAQPREKVGRTARAIVATVPPDGADEASSLASAGPQRQLPPLRSTARSAEQSNRRLNILISAEKLFALRGYHGVSIRDIAADAGVPLALVGYYYGAKHELYRAIFESWSPMIAGRLQGLDAALHSGDDAQRLLRVLDAFVTPVLAMQAHPSGRYYALMAARELAIVTPEADGIQREFFDPMAHAFIDALNRIHPAATRGQVAWCYQFMLGALLHFMTDERVERLSRGEDKAADPEAKPLLLKFIAAGFAAVLGPSQPAGSAAPLNHHPKS